MNATTATPVIFRMFQGEVLALFPGEPGTRDPYTCLSYAHNGQHGSADPMLVIQNSRPATLAESTPLHAELVGIGYELEAHSRCSGNFLEIRRAKLVAQATAA